jgi:hypothetical protein
MVFVQLKNAERCMMDPQHAKKPSLVKPQITVFFVKKEDKKKVNLACIKK